MSDPASLPTALEVKGHGDQHFSSLLAGLILPQHRCSASIQFNRNLPEVRCHKADCQCPGQPQAPEGDHRQVPYTKILGLLWWGHVWPTQGTGYYRRVNPQEPCLIREGLTVMDKYSIFLDPQWDRSEVGFYRIYHNLHIRIPFITFQCFLGLIPK